MRVAFYQFLTDQDTLGGTVKDVLKRKVAGGASITGLTLEASLGRAMAGSDGPLSQRRRDFDIAAVSFNTPGAPRAYAAAKHCKSLGKIVIGGGPHCSLLPREAREYFDAICIGPGDVQFSQMVSDAERGQLKQVYYGSKGDWAVPQRKPSRGLSIVQLSRGCYSNCHMCVVPSLFGKGIDEKPIEMVKAELEQTSDAISVTDDNFPVNTNRGRKVLSLLKDFGKQFICQIAPECAAEDKNLESLAEAGCTIVGVGIESISSQSMAFLGKKPVSDPKAVVSKIHEAGMASYVNLVVGSDGETQDIFDKTLKFVDEARPSMISAHLLTPFPGTKIYESFLKSNRLLFLGEAFPDAWSLFDCRHVTFRPDPLTSAELRDGFAMFMKELYSLRNTLRRARKESLGISLLSSFLKNVW